MAENRVTLEIDLPASYKEILKKKVKSRKMKDFSRKLIILAVEGKIELPDSLNKYLKL